MRADGQILKLYFMTGLPTETYGNLDGIVDLAYSVLNANRRVNDGKLSPRFNVTVSTSVFVPKPNTPFQWFSQDSQETMKEEAAVS